MSDGASKSSHADAGPVERLLGPLLARLRDRRMLATEGVIAGPGRKHAKLMWLTAEPDPDCAAAADEIERLRTFARLVMEPWPDGGLDGAELQEHAIACGLLTPEQRTEPCSEFNCRCAEYYAADEWADGITCYRRVSWLMA